MQYFIYSEYCFHILPRRITASPRSLNAVRSKGYGVKDSLLTVHGSFVAVAVAALRLTSHFSRLTVFHVFASLAAVRGVAIYAFCINTSIDFRVGTIHLLAV